MQLAKYEEIAEWIQGRIDNEELKKGDKIESENEIVAIFGVSRQTVRHAISILENKKILDRVRGSGTFVRGEKLSLHRQREKTMRVAVVTTYATEYIFTPMLGEIEKVLSDADYSMQLSFTNNSIEKEKSLLKGLLENLDIDGVIAEPAQSGLPNPNLYLYEELQKQGVPLLFLNSYHENVKAPHISMDDKQAGKLATEHLIQCGHREIAGIFKADDGQGRRRYAGYMEALVERDMRVLSSNVSWIDTMDMRGSLEEFQSVLRRIKGCTACVCYNDEVAVKLVALCLEQGIRVPEDLSIVGIDNSNLATFCEIPLTSVDNPIRELGSKASLEIIEMMQGNPAKKDVELTPKIVVRHSVKIINDMSVRRG